QKIDRKMFRWTTALNLSFHKDAIVSYNLSRTLAQQYVNAATPPISGIEGKPVYAIYAYRWAGLDPNTGEAQGFIDGEVSKDYASIVGVGTKEEDLEYFGSAIPTRFGNIRNTLSYKAVNLQIGITFKGGYWFRRQSISYTDLLNNGRDHREYSNRWQNTGDERYSIGRVNPYTTNSNRARSYEEPSILVEEADHVRLQYIKCAYDIPSLSKSKGFHLEVNI